MADFNRPKRHAFVSVKCTYCIGSPSRRKKAKLHRHIGRANNSLVLKSQCVMTLDYVIYDLCSSRKASGDCLFNCHGNESHFCSLIILWFDAASIWSLSSKHQ